MVFLVFYTLPDLSISFYVLDAASAEGNTIIYKAGMWGLSS